MTTTKKNLLLVLASCALLNAVPNADAAQKHTRRHTTRMAWSAADTNTRPATPTPRGEHPSHGTKTQEAVDVLYRSGAERTMINPG